MTEQNGNGLSFEFSKTSDTRISKFDKWLGKK